MNTPPYQEGVNYQLGTVIRNSYSFGGDGNSFNVVTKPVENVQYIASFTRAGVAPYGGQLVKCISVRELPY